MALRIEAKVLIAGAECSGPVFVLDEPISFWGGVDPSGGTIIDQRHPQCGRSVGGTILCLPGTIGSSSASSVLLELVRAGMAPAAIILDHPDAILLLGLVVAEQLGWAHPPALQLPKSEFGKLQLATVKISTPGIITG